MQFWSERNYNVLPPSLNAIVVACTEVASATLSERCEKRIIGVITIMAIFSAQYHFVI